jgi:hypothetical protein
VTTSQAGLFSAVSAGFVLDVQSKLQPDASERSEAYLRAILLSLNRSVAPNEDPAAPPAWNGPPTEIITTSDLLYASLLMSLLAAFVAMLGKQWVNRYLRHAGGSMVERCGDRQRKLDGLEKWPFYLFIGSLPVMLQLALLLLACGLSRYVWSVNTSVARVVISFTVLGIIFYVGIVIAGTSSYACPFQTPASTALRALRSKKTTQKLLASLSSSRVISFVYITWRSAKQGLTSRYRRIHDAMINPRPWGISLSTISGIAANFGYWSIILLFRVDRAFGNAKRRLVQWIRRCKRAILLPIFLGDANHQLQALQPRGGLQVLVRNIASLRKRNADNAYCVCWVLRNITDPEAIDSAIRLASTIHWFDGDVYFDPPFDLIVSVFETCFDSTGMPYPGMRDRAYFSGRAVLHINTAARLRSPECASKYPIPRGRCRYRTQDTDKDLYHVLYLFSLPRIHPFTILNPSSLGNTPARSMWMSNLQVDMARVDLSLFSRTTLSRANEITPFSHAIDANVILSWYISLGGQVQEETSWADDKSYAVVPSLPLSAQLIFLCQ